MKNSLLPILLASLLLTACGGGGGSSNVAPIASNDSINIVENITSELNVIDNDTDSDGNLDISSITIQTSPTQGIATVNTTTGNISFVPNTDYTGTDSFSYSLKDDDGEESNQATVTITIDGDVDNDGIGNLTDTDNDGISDIKEIANGTDPLNKDSDSDGIEDNSEGTIDTDNDGTIDALESTNIDADNDGVSDQLDAENVNPNNDSDGDGISNLEENFDGSDPLDFASTPRPFKIKITTIVGGIVAGPPIYQFQIKTRDGYDYNYSVDCDSDGIIEARNLITSYTCSYNPRGGGEFTISIYGKFPLPTLGGERKLLSIEQWGTIKFESLHRAFAISDPYVDHSFKITATDTPNLNDVNDMSYMFANNKKFNEDISNWDVSSVTDMSHMFQDAIAFNSDISNWDVSSVITMADMFNSLESLKSSLPNNLPPPEVIPPISSFNQNIGNWDVSSVVEMTNMFIGSKFNQDISNWNVGAVTNMSSMFFLTPFNQSIDGWDVSDVTNMAGMFERSDFNQNISNWDVSAVTNMLSMFLRSDFNQDISNWDVSAVTNMSSMFSLTPFNQDISNWNISKVTVDEVHGGVLDLTRFSTSNYDKLLLAWSTLNLQEGITLMMGETNYSPTASTARQTIIDLYNWNIQDGGQL